MRRATAFAIAFGLVLLLAFDGGGYDAVLRAKVGLVAWGAVALGLAWGVLPRARPAYPAVVGIIGLFLLAALALLSSSWGASDERAVDEFARSLQYLGIVALALLSLNRYTWRGAGAGLAAAALVVPLFAIGSRLFPHELVDETARTLDSDRLSYPLGYWNAVGAWGAIATAIGLCLSAHARLAVVRALTAAAVPVAVLSVYLSYSRGGSIATALAVLAALALSVNRWTLGANALGAGAASAIAILVARSNDAIATGNGNEGAGAVAAALLGGAVLAAGVAVLSSLVEMDRLRLAPRAAGFSTAAVALGALLVAIALSGPIGDAWEEFRNERTANAGGGGDTAARLTSAGGSRYQVWTSAMDAFESDPSRGIGAGSFEFHWSREGESGEFLRDAHGLYFETLAELGLPGLVFLFAGLGALIVAAFGARILMTRPDEIGAWAALMAGFAVFLFSAGIDWMWEMGAIGTLALGGLVVAAAASSRRAGGRPLPVATVVAGTAAAIALASAQVPGLVSVERIRAADAALARGDAARAIELAGEASHAAPWAASPYSMRALAHEEAAQLRPARSDLREAIDREPENFRHHLILARIEARAGNSGAVKRELQRARAKAPRSFLLTPRSPSVLEIQAVLRSGRAGAL